MGNNKIKLDLNGGIIGKNTNYTEHYDYEEREENPCGLWARAF